MAPGVTSEVNPEDRRSEEVGQGVSRAVGTFRVQGPPKLDDASSWPNYKKRLAIWKNSCIACNVSKMQMGAMIAMSMSDNCKLKAGLATRFYDAVDQTAMETDSAYDTVIKFLEDELGEDTLYVKVRAWNDIESYRRGPGVDIENYISEMEARWQRAEAAGVGSIQADIKAIMMLNRSGCTDQERMIILSQCEGLEKDDFYAKLKKQLKIVVGGGPAAGTIRGNGCNPKLELEAGDADVFVASDGSTWRKDRKRKEYQRLNNKNKATGEINTCFKCKSQYHYANQCPVKRGKEEEANSVELYDSDDSEIYCTILNATDDPNELTLFTFEAQGCGALDTACTSSVAGKKWFASYKRLLGKDKDKIKFEGVPKKRFKFGNRQSLPSLGTYVIPACIAGKDCKLRMDLISSDIPLLISKNAMRKAKVKIDLANDQITWKGVEVKAVPTSAGHLCISLLPNGPPAEIFSIEEEENEEECGESRYKKLLKLHTQFGHVCNKKLVNFLKDAGNHREGDAGLLEKIRKGCKGCILRRKKPSIPKVAFPQANHFNHKVAIDLKIFGGGAQGSVTPEQSKAKGVILHITDMWSRYHQAIYLEDRSSESVANAIMTRWICYLGKPGGFYHDNGGENIGLHVRELRGLLNIAAFSTGAEAAWQNGVSERNHATVDNMLLSLMRDYPSTDRNILLAWACYVKNSMTNHLGFSPNQLVFGKNPDMPSIMVDDGPRALQGKTSSSIMQQHLNILQSTREEFVKSDANDRIRRALLAKIDTSGDCYEQGDEVYYHRGNQWRGPARVMFQDGKIVWVRDGSQYARCSVNRIVSRSLTFKEKDGIKSATGKLWEDLDFSNDKNKEKEGDDSEEEGMEMIVNPDTLQSQQAPILEVDEVEDGTVTTALEALPVRAPDPTPIPTNSDSSHFEPVYFPNTPPVSSFATDVEEQNPEVIAAPEDQTPVVSSVQNEQNPVLFFIPNGENPVPASTTNTVESNSSVETRNMRKRRHTSDDLNETPSSAKVPRPADNQVRKECMHCGKILNVKSMAKHVRTQHHEVFMMNCEQEEEVNIVMVPRSRWGEPVVHEAKQEELQKLSDWKTYELVEDKGQPHLTTTWVVWYKDEEQIRARLVARGFEEKLDLQADSPTVDKNNIRLVLAIASAYNWIIKSSDVKSAFLQGEELERTVLLKPPSELAEAEGKLMLLRTALYGLNDASLRFYMKVQKELLQLGCKQSTNDPALFYKHDEEGRLIGAICTHVDDFLHCGDSEFEQTVVNRICKIFKMGSTQEKNFKYVGYQISQTSTGITVDQNQFAAEKVELFNIPVERKREPDAALNEEEKTLLRQAAGKAGWMAMGTRPDLCFTRLEMSTKFNQARVRDLISADKALRKIKNSESYYKIPSDLGTIEDWSLVLSTDASLGNLDGEKSSGAFLLLLRGKNNSCCPLSWNANRIQKVVGSALAAETLSMQNGFSEGIYLRETIEELFNLPRKSLKLNSLTDSESLYQATRGNKSISDKRLRRDMAMIKQCVNEGEVTAVKWVKGSNMLADVMTKKGANAVKLISTLQRGQVDVNETEGDSF